VAALLKTLRVLWYIFCVVVVSSVAVGIGALVTAIFAMSGLFFTGLAVLILVIVAVRELLGYDKQDLKGKSPR